MTLKLVLLDVEEQVCFDTGMEFEHDFEMLYLESCEDTLIFNNTMYHKRQQFRLIVHDNDGKLRIGDDIEDVEFNYNSEGDL